MRTIFYLSVLFCLVLIYFGYHPEILEKQASIGNPLFSEGESSPVNFPAILGGIVVFFFYVMKFGRWPGPEGAPPGFRPKPTRHFTTWLRYIGWAAVYGCTMLIFYLLIIFFPKLFIDSLNASMDLGLFLQNTGLLQKILLGLKDNPNNLVPYAVIIVTVIWSGVFAARERSFRQSLQESAMIPTEANRLINEYEADPESFQPDKDAIKRIITKIPYHLISKDSFQAGNMDRLERGFAQCEYMIEKIFQLRSKKIFAKTFARYQEDFEETKLKLHLLSDNLQHYKREMLQVLKPKESILDTKEQTLGLVNREWDESHAPQKFERQYFERNQKELEKEMSACLRSILQISVCAALAIGKSLRQRNALLKKLGLSKPKGQVPILPREYCIRSALVILGVAVLSTSVYHIANSFYTAPQGIKETVIPFPNDAKMVMIWSLYSVMMNLLGVFGGSSVQKWLSEERRQFGFSKPHGLNFFDYSTCFVFGFCLNVFLFALMMLPSGRFESFQYAWPWALVSSVSASFTGFYMAKGKELDPINYGLLCLQGGIMAVFSISVLIWHHGFEFILSIEKFEALDVFAIYLTISSFLIGGALSYILQDWIRNEKKGRQGENNPYPLEEKQ